MGQIKAIFAIMSNAERRTALRIIALLFLVGLIEMIGVSSILPLWRCFLRLLIQENDILHYVYDLLGFVEQLDFFFFVGWLVFILLLASLFCKGFSLSYRHVSP